MISTIIFDIGNVLMTFDNKPYLHKLFQDRQTEEQVYGAIWGTGYWDELDRGEDKDILLKKMIADAPAYENEIRTAVENIEQCMSRKDYAIPWIQEMKTRGYRVLYLSNYSTYIMNVKPEVLDFLPYMDGGVFSCNVHLIKPDPEIYQTLMEKYSLIPEECVFLDDTQANVKAARDAGMQGIVFESYFQAREELERVLDRANPVSKNSFPQSK